MREAPLYVLPFEEKSFDVESIEGVVAQAFDFGGDGPPLVFGHATGLHSHAYAPLMARLRTNFHCYGIDVRGQGHSRTPAGANLWWHGISEDFARGLDVLGLSGRGDVFGIGHSQGGFSVISSAVRRPGTYRAIFGFESVIFPESLFTTDGDNHMARNARRRREVFASKHEAYDNYSSKPPLNGIDDDALRAYVEWGLTDNPDDTTASSVRLRCRAESEARLFEGSRSGFFEHLGEVDCRVVVGCSDFTNDAFKTATKAQAELIPQGSYRHFPERSHFGLLERIDDMAAIIVEMFLGGTARSETS